MSLYFKQEGQMSLYFKQEGQYVPYIAHLDTTVYDKRLSRVERVNFDVQLRLRRFICYYLCDIQHVKFSPEMTSLVLKHMVYRLQLYCVIQAEVS